MSLKENAESKDKTRFAVIGGKRSAPPRPAAGEARETPKPDDAQHVDALRHTRLALARENPKVPGMEPTAERTRALGIILSGLLLALAYIFVHSPHHRKEAYRIAVHGEQTFLRPRDITYGDGWIQLTTEDGHQLYYCGPYSIEYHAPSGPAE